MAKTLHSLRYLTGPQFEVVVVRGPTEDGITSVLADWDGLIKTVRNPVRNLSVSRNLGIAEAAGDIVVFIDDDAIPESKWLQELTHPFADPTVGVAGGFVFNPDGVSYQYRYATVDRLGRADLSWQKPAPELVFPLTANFPHPLGANSAFRRAALLAVGGFDEEFDYYLDETDITVRLIDAGWTIAQVAGAHVHHKFAASTLRNEAKVLTSWYSVLKNHIYFGLVNGLLHHRINDVIDGAREFIDQLRQGMEWAVSTGRCADSLRDQFHQDVDQAWHEGLVRGMSDQRRLPGPEFWVAPPSFLTFTPTLPTGHQRCFCFLSQDYPPGAIGGIGRYVYQLARSVADIGHRVHVLTRGDGPDRVDYEDGVWVHRILPSTEDEASAASLALPDGIARQAARLRREIDLIAGRTAIDAVYAPIWDCEGAALLNDPRFALVTALQTTLHFWLDNNPAKRADPIFMGDFAEPMLAAEARMLSQSDAIHAISGAIAAEVEAAYGVPLERRRTFIVPLGLADWTLLPREAPPEAPGRLRLLFVGRLEARKGIDLLLRVVGQVLRDHPEVRIDLVGNDMISDGHGVLYKETFLSDPATAPIRDRVTFHGVVSDEQLRGFYANCDVLVTPSRFESFGLMLLEGMMFGRAVIGCRAGGMPEVVEDGITGLLAEPGDEASLRVCLERLVNDAGLRARLGAAARARFVERHNETQMARGVVDALVAVADAKHSAMMVAA